MSHWFSRKVYGAFALAILVTMVLPWAVLADQVQVDNDLATNGNQNSRSLSASPGQVVNTSGQIVIEYQGSRHLAAGDRVVFEKDTTTLPSAAVGDATITIPSPWASGSAASATSSISFTAPSTPGTYSYSVSWKVKSGPSCISASPSCLTSNASMSISLTVTAPTDTTAPVITPSVVGTLGNNGWYTSNVTLTWSVVDNESTISSSSGCDQVNITADQNATTYTCTATSAGGTASQSVSIKRDATAPVITPGDVNNTTWRNSALSQTFSASDATSGLANSADASFTLTASAESANASTPTVDSKTISDNAGNSATRTLSALIDLTNPVIQASLDKSAAATGWYNGSTGAPTVSFSCSDVLSGLATACPSPYTFGEGANQSHSGSVSDRAGNSNSAGVSGISVDLTAPTITPSRPNNSIIYLSNENNYSQTVTFAGSDTVSGMLATYQPISQTFTASTLGTQSVNVSFTDVAGNTVSQVFTYTVVKTSFLSPLREDAANKFKVGSTIPVKVAYTDANGSITGKSITMKVAAGNLTAVDESTAVTVADSGQSADTNNTFRYDSTCSCYVYNLSTKSGYTANNDYTLFVYDGSQKIAAIVISATK